MQQIDFDSIARAALDAAERLVPQWLPDGVREGREWSSINPLRSDQRRGSFKVNLTTGLWSDFSSGEKGGDLVSLFAYLFHGGKQGEAARDLADVLSIRSNVFAPAQQQSTAAPPKRRSEWDPVIPVPETAGPYPVAHVRRGRPERTWEYRSAEGALLGVVNRFVTSDGGKEILPCVWARHRTDGREAWRWQQWVVPRPLYGLDRLAQHPTAPVLIVEGEKCADAAHAVLGQEMAVISWPGGGKAVSKADWSVLAGRTVTIWPDCDAQMNKAKTVILPPLEQPGIAAAESIAEQLKKHGVCAAIVVIPAPGEMPNGWDVADAVVDGWGLGRIIQFIANVRAPGSLSTAARITNRTELVPIAAAPAEWRESLLVRRGEFVSCLANLVKVLTNESAWMGVAAFDLFAMRTVRRQPLPGRDHDTVGEWTDVDTGHTIIWLTNRYGMTPTAELVDQAIELVAQSNAFHPVREYLDALHWDGTDRIDSWLEDYLGVARDDYSKRVAQWFLIGMVARVMDPGCKFDTCLVLEGAQGRRKSSALRALGGAWFSDTELDLANKDAMSAIRGKWLHEFPEMGSITRAESNRQKSFLARQIDEFRPVFARREIRCPRQLVFAGSTNEWQWQKDPTGGRRFWPVDVAGDIDVEALSGARDALFAEAVHRYKAGERFWPTAEEQREFFDPVQLQRESEDAYFDMIHDWLEGLGRPEFTLTDVLADALKLDSARMTRDVMTRAGMILKKMGCRRRERRNGVVRFVYELPDWTKYQRSVRARTADDSDGALPL